MIKNMYIYDQPREKLEKYGISRLSDTELISIILRTGNKKKTVTQLAEEISRYLKINKLPKISELKKIDGIGQAKASEILASIELGKRYIENQNPKISKELVELMMQEYKNKKKEYLVAFYLNSRNRLIEKELISVGTVDSSLVHPREIFEPALRLSASSVIISHNHPSGDISASLADEKVTEKLRKVGDLLGIPLLDHIIV